MNNFRKRLLRNNNQANMRLWEKARKVYDQRTLREEWDLTTEGHPRFESQLEGDNPNQLAALLAKGKCDG